MMRKRRLAIYGGTFSPPHTGHVRAAEELSRYLSPDELLIIPTYIPPHKEMCEECTCEHRLKMCEIAFSHVKNARISDIEIKRGGKSYTYLTLEALSNESTEMFLLCGTDMFVTLDSWKNPERIFELASICCIRRENDPKMHNLIEKKAELYRCKYGADIRLLSSEAFEISSSDIRRKIQSGIPLDGILPQGVSDYISKEKLYR